MTKKTKKFIGDIEVTDKKLPVSKVLAGAKKLKEIVIVGYDENGEFYFSSSENDGPSVVWLLEKAKKELLEISAADLEQYILNK